MKEPVVRTSRLAWVATARGQATGSEWASRCRSTNMYATEEGNIPRVLDGWGWLLAATFFLISRTSD